MRREEVDLKTCTFHPGTDVTEEILQLSTSRRSGVGLAQVCERRACEVDEGGREGGAFTS